MIYLCFFSLVLRNRFRHSSSHVTEGQNGATRSSEIPIVEVPLLAESQAAPPPFPGENPHEDPEEKFKDYRYCFGGPNNQSICGEGRYGAVHTVEHRSSQVNFSFKLCNLRDIDISLSPSTLRKAQKYLPSTRVTPLISVTMGPSEPSSIANL